MSCTVLTLFVNALTHLHSRKKNAPLTALLARLKGFLMVDSDYLFLPLCSVLTVPQTPE